MLNRVTYKDIIEAAVTLEVKVVEGPIQPGDMYLTGRNTGVKLLTCKSVHPENWITSVEPSYPYDTWECYKVVQK